MSFRFVPESVYKDLTTPCLLDLKITKRQLMSFRLVPNVFYKGLTTSCLLDLKITKSIKIRKNGLFLQFRHSGRLYWPEGGQNVKIHFDVVFQRSGIRSHILLPNFFFFHFCFKISTVTKMDFDRKELREEPFVTEELRPQFAKICFRRPWLTWIS